MSATLLDFENLCIQFFGFDPKTDHQQSSPSSRIILSLLQFLTPSSLGGKSRDTLPRSFCCSIGEEDDQAPKHPVAPRRESL